LLLLNVDWTFAWSRLFFLFLFSSICYCSFFFLLFLILFLLLRGFLFFFLLRTLLNFFYFVLIVCHERFNFCNIFCPGHVLVLLMVLLCLYFLYFVDLLLCVDEKVQVFVFKGYFWTKSWTCFVVVDGIIVIFFILRTPITMGWRKGSSFCV